MKSMNPETSTPNKGGGINWLIVVIIFIVILGGAWYTFGVKTPLPPSEAQNTKAGTMMTKNDSMMAASGSMMQKDEAMMKKDTGMMKMEAYMPYEEKVFQESLKNGKNVVLFFHADWCPTCRNLDAAIRSDSQKIPENTIIFKVNYDTEEALKKEYRVTSQSTTIVLNSHGAVQSRKSGAKNIAEIFE